MTTTIFLFGKLPAFGDFVARGLTWSMRARWDGWLSAALIEAHRRGGVDAAPVGRATGFVVAPSAMDGHGQAGCMIASTDRVGRVFPFAIGVSHAMRIPVEEAGRLAAVLADCLGEPGRWTSLDALTAAATAAIRTGATGPTTLSLVDPALTGWLDAHSAARSER